MPAMTSAELIVRLAEMLPDLSCILAPGYAVLPKGMRARLLRLNKPLTRSSLPPQLLWQRH
jgi:hypothetical protein